MQLVSSLQVDTEVCAYWHRSAQPLADAVVHCESAVQLEPDLYWH